MGNVSLGSAIIVMAVLGGTMIAAQGVVNGRMASAMGGPMQAAFISFSIGWLALLALNLALGQSVSPARALETAPWWAWLGGVMGAVVVTLAAFAVPKIGVATYVSAFIAGQLTAALFYDHFGLLGQTVREITPLRLLGVGLMGAGVFLIRRY
ncbi:MAG: DMT family transporter [Pseudomonadota bacterium]